MSATSPPLPTAERDQAIVARPVSLSATRSPAVLHVFKYFRPDFTGEGLYLEKLAPHLAVLDIRSAVMATVTVAAPGTSFPAAVGTPRFAGRPKPAGGLPELSLVLWFLRNVRRYEVVHFHSPVDRYFVFHAIAKLAGCRVVQTCTLDDGLGNLVAGYRPGYRRLVRRLCRLMIDHLVAISPKLHDDSSAVLPSARMHLIPQGVAIPRLDEGGGRAALRARWGFAESDVVLLFVGGVCARKDVRFLVENHPALAGGEARLRLLLVGPDLEFGYADDLRRLVASLPCRADVMWLPYLDDPSPAYRIADLFVFASRQEGFGNVLLEAMSFGLPVVARRLPGVTDSFIAHGQTGFLFDSAEEYRHTVLDLVARPGLRRAIGGAARQVVIGRFDLAQIARRYAEIYRDQE